MLAGAQCRTMRQRARVWRRVAANPAPAIAPITGGNRARGQRILHPDDVRARAVDDLRQDRTARWRIARIAAIDSDDGMRACTQTAGAARGGARIAAAAEGDGRAGGDRIGAVLEVDAASRIRPRHCCCEGHIGAQRRRIGRAREHSRGQLLRDGVRGQAIRAIGRIHGPIGYDQAFPVKTTGTRETPQYVSRWRIECTNGAAADGEHHIVCDDGRCPALNVLPSHRERWIAVGVEYQLQA